MAATLRNIHLTSIDLVREGANQEADICLFKSSTPPQARKMLLYRLSRRFDWIVEIPRI